MICLHVRQVHDVSVTDKHCPKTPKTTIKFDFRHLNVLYFHFFLLPVLVIRESIPISFSHLVPHYITERDHLYPEKPTSPKHGMGIADLWPILSSENDERVAFPVFLSRFIQKYGRFPRLAIDAYMFMFWSQLPGSENDPNIHRRIIRNFMAKLWYLVQNNVLFVVVFDGKYKPGKLRNGHIPEIKGSTSYDEMLSYFRKLHSSSYSENLSLVDTLKQILQRNCMDYVQAPGEAEAECAWLQRLGVVDYVVSDDSDTLVFGASHMLRLFNRVKFKTEEGDVLSATDYYVNPVHMDDITHRTGLNRDRLLLVATLRGGDYSSGAQNIGITRASEIALCGSTVLQQSPRKALQDFGALPDFTKMFVETFVDIENHRCVLTDPFFSLKTELERNDSLSAFNSHLSTFLQLNAKRVFGRMADMKAKITVDDYYALLYFFPLVNPKVFKFTPYSVSFSDLCCDNSDLHRVNVDSAVSRFNFVCSATDIGKLVISQGVQTFLGTGRAENLNLEKYPLPRERKYNLKSFALKLLTQPELRTNIILSRTKDLDGTVMAVLKFQRQQLNEAVYLIKRTKSETREMPESREPTEILDGPDSTDANDPDSLVVEPVEEDKFISVAVPMTAVRLIAPEVVEEYERQQGLKKSPKKKTSPQKTTLDLIWAGMLPSRDGNKVEKQDFVDRNSEPMDSPTKVVRSLSPIMTLTIQKGRNSLKKASPKKETRSQKEAVRTAKLSPRRRDVLLPGQSKVTSFFRPRGDPFQDTILISSDEETDVKTTDYMQMKNVFALGPILLQPGKASVESRLSSPESSPTKRKRNQLALSPDSSPIKAKKDDGTRFPPS